MWRSKPARRYRSEFCTPNEKAIEAVSSFRHDPHIPVRVAVAFTLGATDKVIDMSLHVVDDLLEDESPLVRLTVSKFYYLKKICFCLKDGLLDELLDDPVWSVRWNISKALCGSHLHDRAWETLLSSVPKGEFFFLNWSHIAVKLANSKEKISELRELMNSKLSSTFDESTKQEISCSLGFLDNKITF